MKSETIAPTDFVIPWVDGDDPGWRQAFAAARRAANGCDSRNRSKSGNESEGGNGNENRNASNEDASEIRYRDWRTLRYWFRGVERFAPWVRRIHFITWGHLPAWLDTAHPKLHVVNHAEYMPAEYLPTFNSNTIELNIARIEGLAERFVLFNDDTFLLRDTPPEYFFRRGVPCDMARLSVVRPSSVGHIVYNDLELINAAYRQRDVLRRHPGKWFSPRYGAGNLLKSLTLAPWSFFTGIFDPHMPQPYLRRSFERAWERWGPQLDASCRNTFRSLTDLSHWLVRYDALCRGEFVPRGFGDSALMTLGDETIEAISEEIRTRRHRMICLNDNASIADFDALSRRLAAAFEAVLPEKSAYER